jgi:hypothetical protein
VATPGKTNVGHLPNGGVDRSRLDARTVALALLCVAVVAFAAATLDSTTSTEGGGLGSLGPSQDTGYQGTPTPGDPGADDDGRDSILDIDAGSGSPCVAWLTRPLVQAGLLLGLVGIFLGVRWYDDAAAGLAATFLVAYPGGILYLLLTACRPGRGLIDLTVVGSPTTTDSGGVFGGSGSVTSPSVATQVLLLLVVGLLGVVAVLVLTGDHDQLAAEADDADEEETGEVPDRRGSDVAAVAAAAGRAADRIEGEGAFGNEVYRAWAEMTDPLEVDHPESSTPGEFAAAAVDAGMAGDDVDRLTDLFAEVRYGGQDPTPEREQAAVDTLRRIEAAYGEDTDDSDGLGGERE